MSDIRCFDHYSSTPIVPNQSSLLTALERLEFETKGEYVLTTKSYGVPVTFMLLIMKEAMEQIVAAQQEISKLRQKLSPDPITNLEPFKITSTKPAGIAFEYWEVPVLNDSPTSGCPMINTCRVLAPSDNKIDLTQYYTTVEPEIEIYKTAIQIRTESSTNRDTVAIHKNAIEFFEFSYALSERVEHEAEILTKAISKEISLPAKGDAFDKNCNRRGSIIHSNFINIAIAPENASISLGKNASLIDAITQGFSEACMWVDSVYLNMLRALPN